MASQINASNSGFGGIVSTGDSSGQLQLQTAGTTALTLDTSQNATFAGKVASAGALTLASNGTTTAVTIDASQNVGIGTASPSRKLDVVVTGTGNVANFQSNAGPNISFTGTESSGRTYLIGEGLVTAGNFSVYDNNASAERLVVDSSGNFKFNSGYGSAATAYGCRAWVNFNGTGTVAIRASGNVSSITDNATGDYTVNFTTTMPDANYSVVIAASRTDNTFTTNIATNNATGTDVAPTTGAIRVVSNGGPGRGPFDVAYFSVSIFR